MLALLPSLLCSFPALFKSDGYLLESLGIDISHIKNPDPERPPPPPETVWTLINQDMITEEAARKDGFIPLGTWMKLEVENCDAVLGWMAEEIVNVTNTFVDVQQKFTASAGLYYLMGHIEHPSNHYLWLTASNMKTQSNLISSHLLSLLSVVQGSPDCVPLSLRKILSSHMVTLKDNLWSQRVLLWAGMVYGMLGDVVEGDVDDDGNIGSPDDVAVWTKDTTFALMWGASVSRVLEQYAQEAVAEIRDVYSQMLVKGEGRAEPSKRLGQYYHGLGQFAGLEAWKRTTFDTWIRDNGLLKEVMRSVIYPTSVSHSLSLPSVSVGDLGAGGGHYAKWLNDTGLATAYGLDGIPGIQEITNGRVHDFNLASSSATLPPWISSNLNDGRFDWVMSIEVAEHLPKEAAKTMIQHLDKLCRYGVIISWSEDTQGIGHANPLPFSESSALIQEVAPSLEVNWEVTNKLRESADVDYIKKTVALFTRKVA